MIASPPLTYVAYHLRALDDAMSPRLLLGEWVLTDPGTAPLPGDDVVVQTTTGELVVRQLVSLDGETVSLTGINGDREPVTHWRSGIVFMHFVAARLPARAFARSGSASPIAHEAEA